MPFRAGWGKRGPKPTKANMIRKLVLQMGKQNLSWGYGRINGELKKLGYGVHWQTVRRVMLDHGLLPVPDKPYKTTWKTFIQSHWDSGHRLVERYPGEAEGPGGFADQPARPC